MNTKLIATLLSAALSINVALASDIEPASDLTAPAKKAIEKIAGSFSNCQIVRGVPSDGSKLDKFDTGDRSYDFLPKQIVNRLAPGADDRDFYADITFRINKQAKHGAIDGENFGYRPKPGFEGVDTASFIFEFEGKKYLIVQKFIVSIPKYNETFPSNCKEAWKLPKPQSSTPTLRTTPFPLS